MTDLDTIDPTFRSDLSRSQQAVIHMALVFHKLGIKVTLPPLSIRPKASERWRYPDDGDLEIHQGIEVKWLTREFTDEASFGFTHVIVDDVHAYDLKEKKSKPAFYYILNSSKTVAVVVNVKATRGKWEVETGQFGGGRDETVYKCPIELVKFILLPEVE